MRSHFRLPRSCAFALVILFGAVACQRDNNLVPSDSDVTRAIEEHEELLRRAIVDADTVALSALLAPEYLSTSAVGHTSNRAETIVAYGAGLVQVDSAVVSDLDVRRYGNTVVSLGLLRWSGTAATHPFAGTVRFQHVWVHNDSSWRLVASQLTNQPAGGPPR